MFFFVGRLLLILLEQDCTCLPCNLLNTISSVYVRGCILYHDDMHPRWLWFSCIHFMWPTDAIKQTLPNLYWSWFFVVIVVAYHFYFLESLIVNCRNDWFCQYKKGCISQAQIAGNNLKWHNFLFFSILTSAIKYFCDIFSLIGFT